MPKKPKVLSSEWEFILPDERELPPEEQGRFWLAPLSQAERLRVRDTRNRTEFQEDGSVRSESRAFRQAFELVRDHLVRTENVPSDAPSAWPGRDAPRAVRDQWLAENLDDLDVLVLGLAIRDAAFLGEPLKNS